MDKPTQMSLFDESLFKDSTVKQRAKVNKITKLKKFVIKFSNNENKRVDTLVLNVTI